MFPLREDGVTLPGIDLSHITMVMGRCLHCGMCLPDCPTYDMTNDERSSPRGRIRLLRSVMDGTLKPGREFADEMNFCLDCRACETSCPAGVRFGELVEHGRSIVSERHLESPAIRIKKYFLLQILFRSKKSFGWFVSIMKVYRRCGLREAVERSGLLSLLPSTLGRLIRSLPDVADSPYTGGEGGRPVRPVRAEGGARKIRAGLLTGCIMNSSFPHVHRATVELAGRCGVEVVVPPGQFCCGSLHGHNGEPGHARKLARDLIRLFPSDLDAIIVNAAGCGSFMKHYHQLFRDDPAMAEIAGAFAAKVVDATEFLQRSGLPEPGALPGRSVTSHDACHLLHGQGISAAPRSLLRSIPGCDFTELPDSARCCGSAGIYNIIRPADSAALLKRKIANIISTGAGVVATANPGCHLQIERGLREEGSDIVVTHPLSLVNEAFNSGNP